MFFSLDAIKIYLSFYSILLIALIAISDNKYLFSSQYMYIILSKVEHIIYYLKDILIIIN